MGKRGLYVFVFLVLGLWVRAQDPIYSLSFEQKSWLNPSLIGRDGEGKVRVSSVHRNLFLPLQGVVHATAAAVDYSFCNSIFALGLNVGSEVQGSGFLQATHASGILGIRRNLQRDWVLNGGLQLGMVQQSINWDSYVFSDQLNPIFGAIYPSSNENLRLSSRMAADVGFGMDITRFRYGKNGSKNGANVGFAWMHLTNASNVGILNNYVLPRRLTVHGSFIRRPNPSNAARSVQLMWRVDRQAQFTNILARFQYYLRDELNMGLGYRGSMAFSGTLHSPVFSLGFSVSEQLNIQVLYESSWGNGRLVGAGNTFEIGIVLRSATSHCLHGVHGSRGSRSVCPVFHKTKTAPGF